MKNSKGVNNNNDNNNNNCAKFKFDSICTTQNLSMKIKGIGDYWIQIDQLISARRPDLVRVNKKENMPYSGLYRQTIE